MAYVEPENITGLDGIFIYANDVSSGIFAPGILLGLWIIVFMYMKGRQEETANCAVVAGFMTSWTAIFLFMLKIISNWELFISIFIFVISILWAYLYKD